MLVDRYDAEIHFINDQYPNSGTVHMYFKDVYASISYMRESWVMFDVWIKKKMVMGINESICSAHSIGYCIRELDKYFPIINELKLF